MGSIDHDQATELQQLYRRFWRNLTRTWVLVAVATSLSTDDDPPELSPAGEDLIRAMVVFLHAAVDDFLRELVRILHERLPEDLLDKLKIRIGAKKADAITLGTLARHPNKLFADVVRESVDDWLGQKSFGDANAVASILTKLRIDFSAQQRYVPGLDKLMKRRHRIVHQADITAPTDSEPQRITEEESQEILQWFHDVDFFVTELVVALLPPSMAEEIARNLRARKDKKAKWEKSSSECETDDP